MGCTSEKSIPINLIQDRRDTEIYLDLQDIEKQGESKHPKSEMQNSENIEVEENNYYNYNLNDLISINTSKMQVKRIENFDDDEDDESDDEKNSDENNEENNVSENKIEDKIIKEEKENDNINDVDGKEIDENKINKIIKDENKLPEDKKPPNLEKLKKKGKEKVEINLFN